MEERNILFVDANPSEKNTRKRQLQTTQARAHAATASHQRKVPRSPGATHRQGRSPASPSSALSLPIRSLTLSNYLKRTAPSISHHPDRCRSLPAKAKPQQGTCRKSLLQPRWLPFQADDARPSCSCAEGVLCASHLRQAFPGFSSFQSIFNLNGPSQGWRTDPFNMLPAGKKISPAIDCWLRVMAPFDDIVQNIFGVTNIYTRSFLELLHDKIFFDVGFPLLLIMIATLHQPYQYPSQELLFYRGKGLKSLRSQIAQAADSKLRPSDSMIAMVAGLCTLERYLGNFDAYGLHAKSLQFMVTARGGLDALGTEGDLKARLLNWDTFWGLIPSTTLFPEARVAYRQLFPSRTMVRSNLDFMRLPQGFIDLAEDASLSLETLNLLVRVKTTLDARRRKNGRPVDSTRQENETPWIPRHPDFQAAYPCLSAPDSPQPNFEKLVCLAVFLFCINAFSPVRSNSNLYSGCRLKISAELRRIDVSLLDGHQVRCLSWIAMMAIESWRRIDVSGVVLLPQGLETLRCVRTLLSRWGLPWDALRGDLSMYFWTLEMFGTWRDVYERS